MRLPTDDEFLAEDARRSLRTFVAAAWPVLEPGTPFVGNWHIDAICDHLEAITRGELNRLIIKIPPRHMKSLAVTVFWPMWEWLSHPERRFLFASYAQSLSKAAPDRAHTRIVPFPADLPCSARPKWPIRRWQTAWQAPSGNSPRAGFSGQCLPCSVETQLLSAARA